MQNDQNAQALIFRESVNDTYLAAWNTIPPQKPDPLRTYVCRIARNLAIAKLRSNTAGKRNSGYDAALDELAEVLPATETVESACDAVELAAAIDRFLSAGGDPKLVEAFIQTPADASDGAQS